MLYESYKEIKEERQSKRSWCNYEIEVISDVKGILNSYQSVDVNNSKIAKLLRLSINRKKIGSVKKVPENNKKEKI